MSVRKGFTLIEVLLAMVIATIAVAGMGALLMGAGRVMNTLDSKSPQVMLDTLIAVERMKKELQESPVYPAIAFEGKKDKVAFPKLTVASAEQALNNRFVLGQIQQVSGGAARFTRVEYRFDKGKEALLRRQEGLEEKAVLEGLADCRFSYAIGSTGDDPKIWADETPFSGNSSEGHSPPRIFAMEIQLQLKSNPGYPAPFLRKTFLFYRQHPSNASSVDERMALLETLWNA